MSQTQTITNATVLRLKLPEKVKLPIGVPKEFKNELKLPEIKTIETNINTLPLDQQLGAVQSTGTTTIGKIHNSVDAVTVPPIRPTLQNPSLAETFKHKVTKREKAQIIKTIITEESKLPQFVVLGTDLRLMSFTELKKIAVYQVTNDKDSGLGSINDPRGGVIDDGDVCATCRKDNFYCPGHPGIITFNRPIIHPKGISFLIKILSAICRDCASLKVSKEILEQRGILKRTGLHRFESVVEIAESMPCTYVPGENEHKCNPNPIYDAKNSKETNIIFYSEKVPGKKEKRIMPLETEEVLKILKLISDEDARLLGFIEGSRPEDLVMQAFYVIPPISRVPSIREGTIWPHHLTIMYKDIAADNIKIIGAAGTRPSEAEKVEAYSQLIFHVRHFMDNSDQKYMHMSSKPFESIKDLIQGKEGIITNLLLGKRVNFVGRTVISPDPSLKFGQVRVPRIWESILTIPVKIFKENLSSMLILWKEGRITHYTPGSGDLQGSRINIDERTRSLYQPKIGDTVERWCKNGDVVLFNRQPTIQKEAMMGYEIVLGEGNTIGLNLAAYHPHNADMDGDESPVHMLQALDAIVDTLQIANSIQCLSHAQTD